MSSETIGRPHPWQFSEAKLLSMVSIIFFLAHLTAPIWQMVQPRQGKLCGCVRWLVLIVNPTEPRIIFKGVSVRACLDQVGLWALGEVF